MIDPTWVGGISQTRRVAELAQFYNVPVVMHDCTGPFTLLSGIHVGMAASNVAWQETLRAHIRLLYPQLIREPIPVVEGQALPPQSPGMALAGCPSCLNAAMPTCACRASNETWNAVRVDPASRQPIWLARVRSAYTFN